MIPFSINKLTLKQFMSFAQIEQSDMSNYDKAIAMIASCLNKSIEDVENLPRWEVEYYAKQIGHLNSTKPTQKLNKHIWVKGKRYSLLKDIKDLNANQLVCWETFVSNPSFNYNKLIALVYVRNPLFKKGAFSTEDFTMLQNHLLKMKVKDVIGAYFFFQKEYKACVASTLYSILKGNQVIVNNLVEIEAQLQSSGRSMAGITSLTALQAETLFTKMN